MGVIGGKDGYKFTVRQADTLRRIDQPVKVSEAYLIEGSCNGLHLLVRYISTQYDKLTLWNPSVRKLVQLPSLDDFIPPRPHNYLCHWGYIVGFDPSRNDYKVVAFEYNYSKPDEKISTMAVYTLSNNILRVKSTCEIDACGAIMRKIERSVFFNGSIHWLVAFPNGCSDVSKEPQHTHLASFNMDTENFSYLELSGPREGIHRCLCLVGESVAIFTISLVNCSIWVKKQHLEEASWSLMFSGPSSKPEFDFFIDNPRWKVFYIMNTVAHISHVKIDRITLWVTNWRC